MRMMKKKSQLYSAAKKGIAVAISVVMALPASLANVALVQAEETQIEVLPVEPEEAEPAEALYAEPAEKSGAAYEEPATVDVGIALYEEAYASDSEAKTYEGFTYEVTEENTVTITRYNGSDTELTIPAEIEGYPVTSIGTRAFLYCSSLTSVRIPESVTSIGDYAFLSCTGLREINVASDNVSYSSIDGVLFSQDKTVLIC